MKLFLLPAAAAAGLVFASTVAFQVADLAAITAAGTAAIALISLALIAVLVAVVAPLSWAILNRLLIPEGK